MWILPLSVALAGPPSDGGFLYQRAPGAVSGAVAYGVDVGVRPSGALRFADPALGQGGVAQRLGGEAAVAPWLDVAGWGLLSLSEGDGARGAAGASVRASRMGDHVGGGLELGVHRELGGGAAATLTASGAWDVGRLAVGASVLAERRFVADADPLDLMVPLAMIVDIGRGIRVGAEYVGQDLEGLLEEDEAEGGASHVAAVTGAWTGGPWILGVSPGFTLGADGVGFSARACLTYRLGDG